MTPPSTPLAREQEVLLKRLDAFFDEQFSSLKIMSLPRATALAHALRVAEFRQLMNELQLRDKGEEQYLWPLRREHQDGLKCLVYRLFAHINDQGTVVSTGDETIRVAEEAVGFAERYAPIADTLSLCRLGLSVVTEGPANTFKCEMIEKAHLERLRATLPNSTTQRMRAMARIASRSADADDRRIALLLQDRVRPTGPLTFRIRVDEDLLRACLPVAERIVSHLEYLLPEEWSIGPYTLGEFRRCWSTLVRLTVVHRLGTTAVIGLFGRECAPFNTPIVEIHPKSLVAHISHHSGVARPAVEAIVGDLTYDPARVRHTDIMYQPLVPASEQILILPSIIEGSNAERNLVVLWNKIPEREKVYSMLSAKKEDLFLDELEGLFREHKIESRRYVRISKLTDADLVVWRSDEQVFLIVQAKWLYGGDSIREVLSHDQQLLNGIKQAETAITWAKENPREFLRLCGLDERRYRVKEVLGIVASKVGDATCYAWSDAIPVVEPVDLRNELNSDNSVPITRLHARLLDVTRPKGIAKAGEEVKIEFPPYTFLTRAYTL